MEAPLAPSKYILAIDQGTTGTTALLIDKELRVVAKHNVPFEQHFPEPGWVEHKAEDIWHSIEVATTQALQAADISGEQIEAIGITNQRETTTAFKPNGEAYAPFIVWQCKRSEPICETHRRSADAQVILDKTGLVIDPYFSATKMQWLLQHNADIQAQKDTAVRFGTIDTWIIYRLTNGAAYVTDVTNASRTLLVDLEHPTQWNDDLLDIFGVPRQALPDIKSSSEIYGHTSGLSFLPDGIPIAGIAGDQQAALFGQACFAPGQAKCTYGTGCFLLMHTGNRRIRSAHGLLTTIAASCPGEPVQYALEGAAFIGGAAVQWLRDGLGLIEHAADIESLASKASDTGDVVFVPALSGLGAPHWRPEAKGLVAGISRDTTKAHLARAVLEGVAMQNADILQAMSADASGVDIKLQQLHVDGGAAANDLLMQMQSDALQATCIRPEVIETTGLGAAALAALATGFIENKRILQSIWKVERRFEPSLEPEAHASWLHKWHRAVERS